MAVNFLIHRVFCSTAGDLEELRRVFDHQTGVVNEAVGMPRRVLLAPVSCPPATGTGFFNAEIRENIRQCSFFVQVLGDSWGPPAAKLQRAYELAIACRDDPKLPMREVALFLEAVPAERCSADVIEFLRIQSRPFIFTASGVPAAIAAALAAVRICRSEEGRALFAQVLDNARYLHAGLSALGLQVVEPTRLAAVCRCSAEGVDAMLRSFPPEEVKHMIGDDGMIGVTCEFCSTKRVFNPADYGG